MEVKIYSNLNSDIPLNRDETYEFRHLSSEGDYIFCLLSGHEVCRFPSSARFRFGNFMYLAMKNWKYEVTMSAV